MRLSHLPLVCVLALAATLARADSFVPASTGLGTFSMAEGSTTTANNTSEQTLVEFVSVQKLAMIVSAVFDMTNASTLTAMNFKVYRKRGAGSYVLLGTPANPTGVMPWTLATASKGFEALTFNVVVQPGDSFKVTGTQTVLSAAFAIPYTVVSLQ